MVETAFGGNLGEVCQRSSIARALDEGEHSSELIFQSERVDAGNLAIGLAQAPDRGIDHELARRMATRPTRPSRQSESLVGPNKQKNLVQINIYAWSK